MTAPGDRVVYAPSTPPYQGAPPIWQVRRASPSLVLEVGPRPADPRGHNVRLFLPGQHHGDGEWWAREEDLRVVARAVYVAADAPTRDPSALAGSTVALDFDGPVHSYGRGWTGYVPQDPPTPGALRFVLGLLDAGARVVIHTSRADTPRGVAGVRGYLAAHGFPPLEVTYEKVPAAAYVDDRAVHFDPRAGDWPRVLSEVVRLCAVRHRGETYEDERFEAARRTDSEALTGGETLLDTASSASRQHYIDTGEHLRAGEAEEA